MPAAWCGDVNFSFWTWFFASYVAVFNLRDSFGAGCFGQQQVNSLEADNKRLPQYVPTVYGKKREKSILLVEAARGWDRMQLQVNLGRRRTEGWGKHVACACNCYSLWVLRRWTDCTKVHKSGSHFSQKHQPVGGLQRFIISSKGLDEELHLVLLDVF